MVFTKFDGLDPGAAIIYRERLTDQGINRLYTLSIDLDDDESSQVVEILNALFKS